MENEAIADSDINMESAQETLSDELFPADEVANEDVPIEEIETEDQLSPDDQLEAETPEEVTEEAIDRPAPQSWKKESHDIWNNLPPEAQDYIEQRETQMKEGLEKDRGDSNLGRIMRDTMAPYSDMLKTQGIDEPTMVKTMMNAHYRLSTASPQEKVQLFNQLAQNYGVTTDGTEATVDPAIQKLQDELNGVKSTLSKTQEATLQAAREKVQSEVEAFASDPEHSYFDEVADDLIPFLNAGVSLEDAYEKAVWANHVTRQKEQDRILKVKEESLLEESKVRANTAKKAKSTNVRSRDTKRTPTGPVGTMEDTMHETLRDIKTRN